MSKRRLPIASENSSRSASSPSKRLQVSWARTSPGFPPFSGAEVLTEVSNHPECQHRSEIHGMVSV